MHGHEIAAADGIAPRGSDHLELDNQLTANARCARAGATGRKPIGGERALADSTPVGLMSEFFRKAREGVVIFCTTICSRRTDPRSPASGRFGVS